MRPEVRERLALEGRERRLLYMTAILTGMRQGELGRLLVSHLRLTAPPRRSSSPRSMTPRTRRASGCRCCRHAAELAAWMKDTGKTEDDLVFYVPEKPNKIFRRDLKAAGSSTRTAKAVLRLPRPAALHRHVPERPRRAADGGHAVHAAQEAQPVAGDVQRPADDGRPQGAGRAAEAGVILAWLDRIARWNEGNRSRQTTARRASGLIALPCRLWEWLY